MTTPPIRAWFFGRTAGFVFGWLFLACLGAICATMFSGYGENHWGEEKLFLTLPLSFATATASFFILSAAISWWISKAVSGIHPIGAWCSSAGLILSGASFLGGLNLQHGLLFSLLGAILAAALGMIFYLPPLLLERALTGK